MNILLKFLLIIAVIIMFASGLVNLGGYVILTGHESKMCGIISVFSFFLSYELNRDLKINDQKNETF